MRADDQYSTPWEFFNAISSLESLPRAMVPDLKENLKARLRRKLVVEVPVGLFPLPQSSEISQPSSPSLNLTYGRPETKLNSFIGDDLAIRVYLFEICRERPPLGYKTSEMLMCKCEPLLESLL